MNSTIRICLFVGGLLIASSVWAQKKKPAPVKSKPKTTQTATPKSSAKESPAQQKAGDTKPATDAENEKRVRDIVAFLEYLLNTLGSSSTSIRDKEVVIRESYAKIFRDEKVQIEDDLENREVVTNKDVVAYLKDVDFFFIDVRFELNIESIQGGGTDNNKVFYKVALQRNLKGTTLDGKQVNNTIPRFIEVNYDPDAEGLKIASMYTKGFDEKVALTAWWNDLSHEWRGIFQRKLNLTADSLTFDQIKLAASVDSLDLSNNLYVRTLEPLAQLSRLRYLNLNATTIGDLTPIRNLTAIVDLSLSGTSVKDLQPMRYAADIRRLDISNTSVESLEPVQKMPLLQSLNASYSKVADVSYLSGLVELRSLMLRHTPVFELGGIANLRNLEFLNVAATGVTDLTPLSSLPKLLTLNIDSTRIRDLRPLSTLTALQELSANYSRIDNLEALKAIPGLKRIYCDQTQIVRSVAESFISAKPGVLIVYDSKDLKSWWEGMTADWQQALLPGRENPSKDDLARVTNIDSISLRAYPGINTLSPLRKMTKIRVLDLAGTSISDLSPIRDLKEVTRLDISGTSITDLGPLRFWKKLAVLKADSTRIQNLDPLAGQSSLKKLYVDNTGIHDVHAREFLEKNGACLLVYKTYHANRWWNKLSSEWKGVFESQIKTTSPATEQLHSLLESKSLSVKDVPVSELNTLSEFVQLEELKFSGTGVRDLAPVAAFSKLKVLHATNSPLKDLEAIGQMTWLEDLDISGTPIDDLKAIRKLTKLKKFNCAGTQVRKLEPLKDMQQLEFIDCSNTSVSSLDAVEHLPLKTVKCFNSRVSRREVEGLRKKGVDVVFYK